MTDKEKESLQKYIDTLIDENSRLLKKIEILEAEKSIQEEEKSIQEKETNIFEQKIENALEKLLREHKTDYDKYRPYYDDDWSYRPRRGTDGHPYWPYIPGPGDWPPGPQVGDVPPGTIPPGYPYWSIFPPYWPIPYYKNTLKTNTTGDPVPEYPYTVSKTGEKIER